MKIVKRRLADGTVKEYRYEVKAGTRLRPKTIGALIEEYRRSPAFTRKKPNTRKAYHYAMNEIGEFRDVAIADIKRRHILRQRDSLQHKPAFANQILTMWSVLLQFAVDREYVLANIAFRIERFEIGEHQRWPERIIQAALTKLPIPIYRAVLLALYTGQRRSDCVAMLWSDWDGEGISVTQEKTGAKLWIPCHPELAKALREWKQTARAITILETPRGAPWSGGQAFTAAFCRARKTFVPELMAYPFHGLRKSAAAMLAEAGCTTHEIAAITGHATLSELERYTREAEQKRRAQNAIAKLIEFRPGGEKTPEGKRRKTPS